MLKAAFICQVKYEEKAESTNTSETKAVDERGHVLGLAPVKPYCFSLSFDLCVFRAFISVSNQTRTCYQISVLNVAGCHVETMLYSNQHDRISTARCLHVKCASAAHIEF